MRLMGSVCLMLVGLIMLSGCQRSPLAANWPSKRPLGGELPSYRPSELPGRLRKSDPQSPPRHGRDGEPSELKQAPTGELKLKRALSVALMRNPELASFGWQVRAAEARTLQASLWPNPTLGLEAEGLAGTAGGEGLTPGETAVRLKQPILTGGEIAKRTRVAELESDLAAWDYETKRLDVFTNVVQRFVGVLGAQRRLDVAQRTFDLAERTYQTVTKQVQAGEVSPVEQTRAKVELSRNRVDLKQAREALSSSRFALAEVMGLEKPTFRRVVGDLEASVQAIPEREALTKLLEQNPAIARWASEMAQRRAQVELAEAEGIPDVTVGAGAKYLRGPDTTAAIGNISVPLTIFDRNQGEVLARRFEVAQGKVERRAAKVRVATALGRRYQDLQAAYQTLTTLRNETLPGARQAYQSTRQSFDAGQIAFLRVLDAQRTLFQVEGQYVQALARYHRAAAAVERLIAQPLNEVGPAGNTQPASTQPARPVESRVENPQTKETTK